MMNSRNYCFYYDFISAGLSEKFGKIENKIISLIKFFPFIFCVAGGLTIVIKFGGVETTK